MIDFAKILLLFYILTANNYTGDLMGKQWREFLQENRIGKHLVAFIMMLILIIMFGNVKDTSMAIFYAVIGYSWFVFTTKMDIQWNVIVLLTLLLVFLYQNKLEQQEINTRNDTILSENEKQEIINKNNKVKEYVIMGTIIITLIGMFLYVNKKEGQYGGGKFSPVKFFLY